MLNSLMSDPGLVLLILFIFMLVCRVPDCHQSWTFCRHRQLAL